MYINIISVYIVYISMYICPAKELSLKLQTFAFEAFTNESPLPIAESREFRTRLESSFRFRERGCEFPCNIAWLYEQPPVLFRQFLGSNE